MFDILSADDFFKEIRIAFNRLSNSKTKRSADLLFVILGLSHLREWIAPGFRDERMQRPPKDEAERFFLDVHENADWRTLNAIGNQTKHKGKVPKLRVELNATYSLDFDSWESVDDARDFDRGPPSAFTLDGENIEPLLARVIAFYDSCWFARSPAN